jgi:opacity protein-like surface antigen
MKKLIFFSLAILLTGVLTNAARAQETGAKKEKQDQNELYNDFYFSVGTGTIYYFVENDNMKATSLSGTFLLGFSRSINHVISVGFQLSYTNIGRSEEAYNYSNGSTYTQEQTDNLWQGIANIRFRYLNKPAFCMYSGVGMGVTMDYYTNTDYSGTDKGQKLLPAGQLTLLGFRVGRALSFFGEFGIGTNSIVNAGVSYKFGE